jgi:hypothetical protein
MKLDLRLADFWMKQWNVVSTRTQEMWFVRSDACLFSSLTLGMRFGEPVVRRAFRQPEYARSGSKQYGTAVSDAAMFSDYSLDKYFLSNNKIILRRRTEGKVTSFTLTIAGYDGDGSFVILHYINIVLRAPREHEPALVLDLSNGSTSIRLCKFSSRWSSEGRLQE